MANKNDKVTPNVAGPYYVDSSCIDCDRCRSDVPSVFTRQDDQGASYVYRQPITPEEIAMAEEARLSCPSDSIGNDG
jgi:ferredoxin